ncbi:MAG: uncharacterized protein JWM82_4401 [Myxococcales bacterium]|nr:uncharacterized protein [Myxococcales bacterium]
MRQRDLWWGLFGVVFALGNGCAAKLRRPAPSSSNTTTTVASAPELTWAVQNRFRLLEPRPKEDATRVLFDRFAELYAKIGDPTRPPEHWNVPETRWNCRQPNWTCRRYDPGYVDVSRWDVRLDAHLPGKCNWRFETEAGGGTAEPQPQDCRGFSHTFGPGRTKVTATAVDDAARTTSAVVAPRDVIIASLGDSYASGEGVPDLAAHKSSPSDLIGHDASWMDHRCRRSLFSGPGLAALEYAIINEHVSVTHVTFACSGATLNHERSKDGHADGGLLLPYSGVWNKDAPALEAQVDALKATLAPPGHAPADADFLTITIGGNDLGFGDAVEAAIEKPLSVLQKVVGEWKEDADRRFTDESMKQLRGALDDAHASVKYGTTVIVNDYPDPTSIFRVSAEMSMTDAVLKENCGIRNGRQLHFAPPYSIDELKVKELQTTLITEVLTKASMIRGALEGIPVDSHELDAYQSHGYCALGLNTPGMPERWVNTVPDSAKLYSKLGYVAAMASDPARGGSMHPNIRGQAEFARILLLKIVDGECEKHPNQLDSEICSPNRPWLDQIPIPGGRSAEPGH